MAGSPSSYSSISSLYPSSISSVSPPLPSNLASPPRRQSEQLFERQARDHLDGLIKKHGHPTVVYSSSSLRSLTSTSPTGRPPSPTSPKLCPVTATADALDTLRITPSGTRPIPIPRVASTGDPEDFPITPLTGRFDEGHLFLHADQCPRLNINRIPTGKKRSRGSRLASRPKSDLRMHSDGATQLYTPSAIMAQSGRPISPQPSRGRSQKTPKKAPGIHLGTLPRFHPAVYQSAATTHNTAPQPPSPLQQRPQAYRMPSGSRDALRQYRELVTNAALPRNAQGAVGSKPSAPRLDPLGSPGPVTPLTLEEEGGYLVAGAVNPSERPSSANKLSAPSPELIERLIQRENERIRLQKHRQDAKGR